MPVGGKFRLVDIPISNSLNSGVQKIFVLTQFNSASLNAHISQSFQFSPFSRGFVQTLAADQTTDSGDWYQGTADAVRRSLTHIRDFRPRYVLILSGDQLYRMDFRPMIERHVAADVDVTISLQPVTADRTSAFGIAKTDKEGRVHSFLEKPKDPSLLSGFELPKSLRQAGEGDVYGVSMGIYLFRYDVLVDELDNGGLMDFGHEILPRAVKSRHVASHLFRDYWEDIGTIRAYYNANIDLARADPEFVFYSTGSPIYTRPRFLGASRVQRCRIRESMICDGCFLYGGEIGNSVIGIRSIVDRGSSIRHSVILGADIYDSDIATPEGAPALGIGKDCEIEGAIVDKNARIGPGVKILRREPGSYEDHENFCVRDGIVVIPKNAVIPEGAVI